MLWRNYRSGINPSQFAPLLEFWSFVQREEIGAEEPAGRLGFFFFSAQKADKLKFKHYLWDSVSWKRQSWNRYFPLNYSLKKQSIYKGKRAWKSHESKKKEKWIPSKCDRFTQLIRDYNGLPLQEYRKEQQDIHNRELGLSFEVTIGSLPDVSKSCPESHYHTLACHLVIRYLLILYIWKSRGQLLSGGCRLGSHHARIKIHLKFHL